MGQVRAHTVVGGPAGAGAGVHRGPGPGSAGPGDPVGLRLPRRPGLGSVPPRLEDPSTSNAQDQGGSALRWVGWGALVVLAVGLLAAPRGLRALLRRRRLAGESPEGAAEAAWAEVRATALDLRLGWDDGVTLRRRARALVPFLAPTGHGTGDPGAPGHDGRSAVGSLERLVLLLERARFSRAGLSGEALEEMPALAVTVTEAMHRAARPSVQRRATWLPASLWSGRQSGPWRGGAGTVDRTGGLDRVSV